MSSGWHPDPTGRHESRFNDGTEWTAHVMDGQVPSLDPLPEPDGHGPEVAPSVRMWLLAGAAAMILGSFLPWATALGGVLSRAGTTGDGVITLALGAVIAAMTLWGRWRWVSFVAGLAGFAVALYHLVDLLRRDGIDPGVGVWLTAAGCVAVVIASASA